MKILKFHAKWCGTCKPLTKLMDEIDFNCDVISIDVDESIDIVVQYNVRGLPTLIVLDDNDNIISTLSGVITKQDLLSIIQ